MSDVEISKLPSRFSRIIRWVIAWLAGSVMTGLMATILSTQFVISDLAAIGAKVPLSKRLFMTGGDIIGLGPLYTAFLAIGLLIAFLVATGLSKFWLSHLSPALRRLLFIGAGLVSVITTLVLMKQAFFGVDLIAGSRSAFGFVMQVLCGAAGGYVFGKVTRPYRKNLG